jgi:glyoxylase-like metal-dependent hydrolase (beta-lactamase superfamily II)/rhodanese-related sulfurtransferase
MNKLFNEGKGMPAMEVITVETLSTWLAEERPLTILDVCPTAERAEWWIPGSIHVDAYEALKAHDPAALAHVKFPDDRPVVTVCVAGVTSLIAAEQLTRRGIEAYSLKGGMKAWSLAWNTAEILQTEDGIRVIQVRRTGKGCLSYLIGVGISAVVIDACLEPQVYLDLAAQYGWRICTVLDTHIHADHLSRSRQLAIYANAMLFLPDQKRVSFPFIALYDNDMLTIESLSLSVLHTPGHTAESTCYLLNNTLLLTGDTLSLTGVGRPDLLTDPSEAQTRASQLYTSCHTLLDLLPAETLVLPGHTGTPVAFDGHPIMTSLAKMNKQVALLHETHDAFVQTVLHHLPSAPRNYELIAKYNRTGMLPKERIVDLEAGANRCTISSSRETALEIIAT